MEFKFNSNIFKNTPEDQQRLYGDKYDPNKNYPVFTGTASIPKSQLPALVEYLHWALRTELKTDSYLDEVVIPIKISGWQKESKSGKKFLSLAYSADYKTMTAAREAKEAVELADSQEIAQHQQSLDDAAANLAKSTAGAVVKPDQEDIF
jgi:hypothetical protein|tara:strand:+ start:603 stop:1052 length:450 start_codon:yes stop_codon:yes gene_type:complete